MKPNSSIAKGKLLEDFIAEQFRATGLDPRAQRTHGSGSGMAKGDIWNSLGLSIECKNQKRAALWEWMKQSERDSMDTTHPVVIAKPPGKPLEGSVAVIEISFFLELLQSWRGTSSTIENPNLKWPLRRLIEAAKALLKEVDSLEA